ncbi:hypothetical protein F2Q69_00013203 [Brassica cretica]|uniref:Uncharacterized protein n=1 Tax=Brassica cretica TaxID=69181 RepID=A0A8S9R979_BRACR|nr:hypothetical protein F2Q69_00013203 [Brassica cretica]
MWSTRWIGQARGVAMHATRACGQTCGGRGVSLHGSRPCIQTGRGLGVTFHVSRSCNQPCGARGVAVHASGAMRSDTRAATRLISDCYSVDFELAPGEGSAQVKRDQFLWRQVQDQSGRGSTWKVEKGFRSQKFPLLGSWIMEGGQLANAECLDDIAKLWIVRSGQRDSSANVQVPVTWKLDHGRRPGILELVFMLDSGMSVPSDLIPSGFKETPYSLDREDSDERGHVLWLSITRRCNVAVTRRTLGCRAVTRRTVGRGQLKVPSSGLCCREIGYCR